MKSTLTKIQLDALTVRARTKARDLVRLLSSDVENRTVPPAVKRAMAAVEAWEEGKQTEKAEIDEAVGKELHRILRDLPFFEVAQARREVEDFENLKVEDARWMSKLTG